MSKLTTARRRRLPDSAFAIPERREYPIDTRSRGRAALARVAHDGTLAEQRRVAEAVHRRYPTMIIRSLGMTRAKGAPRGKKHAT